MTSLCSAVTVHRRRLFEKCLDVPVEIQMNGVNALMGPALGVDRDAHLARLVLGDDAGVAAGPDVACKPGMCLAQIVGGGPADRMAHQVLV